jgi:hypothetical protein
MTQTMYAHVNKWILKKERISAISVPGDKNLDIKTHAQMCAHTHTEVSEVIFNLLKFFNAI